MAQNEKKLGARLNEEGKALVSAKNEKKKKKKFFPLTPRKLPRRMCAYANIYAFGLEEFPNQPFPK